jgi:hypothetical protein
MELNPSWEATSCSDTQDFPNILWNPRFITVFTRALHWSLSWAIFIQSYKPTLISLRSVLILTSRLCLGLPSNIFLSSFPQKILYAIFFALLRATCYTHIIFRDLTVLIIFGVQFMKLFIMQLSPSSYNFIPLWSKYSPQHPVLKYLRSMSETKFHTHTKPQAKL